MFDQTTTTVKGTPMGDYIAGQFSRLDGATEFKIKVTSCVAGEQTNWLDASPEVVNLLRAALMGELSVAKDDLRAALNKWGASGPDTLALADAGDDLANAARAVLELLPKAGR